MKCPVDAAEPTFSKISELRFGLLLELPDQAVVLGVVVHFF